MRPLNVQAERGYLQVVSPAQVKHEIRKADGGLLKLEPLELPAEFRLLSSAPSLAIYQYTARPFALEVGVEWYAAGETVDQVVDFAKLTSQISRDGQVVTDAQFFVKTRGRKALRLELPAGAKLWWVGPRRCRPGGRPAAMVGRAARPMLYRRPRAGRGAGDASAPDALLGPDSGGRAGGPGDDHQALSRPKLLDDPLLLLRCGQPEAPVAI
ncbi:MAG: hypothetical protein HGA45_35720 [Chloroflexales bacterium]|nr:hypothetical protein [Chloroflexales bacterium]